MYGQVRAISSRVQSLCQPIGEAHLKKATFSSAWAVVEPVVWDSHVLRCLGSRFPEVLRQGIGRTKNPGRCEGDDIYVFRGAWHHACKNQCRATTNHDLDWIRVILFQTDGQQLQGSIKSINV